ncbi:MAG TPA: hypothetical protein VNH11_25615 [Pirellulales bacterium]|nr:hypothetical protein [Pirellulales bacterium]
MDPVEASSRWQRWAVSGTANQIDRVLASLDANLPSGWKPLAGMELAPFQSLVNKGSAWYATDTTTAHEGAALSLERIKDSELRGGRVCFSGSPYPGPTANISNTWNEIIRLLDDGIIPAARAAGANLRLPSSEDVFFAELPSGVGDHLKAFSDQARKSLPLNRAEAERWHEFVVAAFRSKTVIDGESFVQWLVANGWQQESAKALNLRLLDDSLLLSRFIDEVLAV